MTNGTALRAEIFDILDRVMDPEVPVLSIVELGIVRDVVATDHGVSVILTPTYSGCPAMRVIEQDIHAALAAHGLGPVTLETVYAPAWTTEWLSDAAKRKLAAAGVAPPPPVRASGDSLISITRRSDEQQAVRCPYCGSEDTTLRSTFGSTACKAIHFCNGCRQPFEQFKAL